MSLTKVEEHPIGLHTHGPTVQRPVDVPDEVAVLYPVARSTRDRGKQVGAGLENLFVTQLGGTLSHFNLGPANPGSIEGRSHRNIEGLGLEAISGPQRNVYPGLGRDVAAQQKSERVAENPLLIAGPNERRQCIG